MANDEMTPEDWMAMAEAEAAAASRETPASVVKGAAKEYAPYVGTGIGEDASMVMAGLARKAHVDRVGKLFGYPGLGAPETYQSGMETVTGKWPQPQTPGQYGAKYLGNAIPPLAVLGAVFPQTVGGILGGAATGAGAMGAYQARHFLKRLLPHF